MPLKIKRDRDSPNWRCRGTVRGIAFDRSTKTTDRNAAEALRIQWEGALLERGVHGARATATFAEGLVSYLKAGGETRYCTPLLDHFGETPLVQIDQTAIDGAAAALKPGAGPAARNRQMYTPMSAIPHHAAKRGMTEFRLLERPKEPKGRVRWLKPDEAERLIDACAPHLRPLVIFLFGTGARLTEALYLDWQQVDLTARRVSFLETKNGEARGVPLNERVLIELANLPHREGAVFRWQRPKARRGHTERPIGKPYARRRRLRRADQDRVQGRLQARQDQGFHAARLSAYVGVLVLCRDAGSSRAHGAGRLEIGADGFPLHARQPGPFGGD